MVFEQMLTILLGTGAGVAVVLFAVKPRQPIVTGGATVETFPLASPSIYSESDATPMLEFAAGPAPVLEAPVQEFQVTSPVTFSTMTAEAPAAVSSDVSTPSTAAPRVSAPTSRPETMRSHRVQRRSAASSRERVSSRAAGPADTTLRRLEKTPD